jgi:divalent metal cation (Fe/Co/Zn/Cd) transporter
VLQTASRDAIRRIQGVETVTIAWMSVEALVSLFAAWRARSPALLAFGGDSAIELFSAVIVLWRFRPTAAHEDAERRAARVAGALLFVVAAYVAITSVASLLGYSEPKTTFTTFLGNVESQFPGSIFITYLFDQSVHGRSSSLFPCRLPRERQPRRIRWRDRVHTPDSRSGMKG